jgi:hypothetical protein
MTGQQASHAVASSSPSEASMTSVGQLATSMAPAAASADNKTQAILHGIQQVFAQNQQELPPDLLEKLQPHLKQAPLHQQISPINQRLQGATVKLEKLQKSMAELVDGWTSFVEGMVTHYKKRRASYDAQHTSLSLATHAAKHEVEAATKELQQVTRGVSMDPYLSTVNVNTPSADMEDELSMVSVSVEETLDLLNAPPPAPAETDPSENSYRNAKSKSPTRSSPYGDHRNQAPAEQQLCDQLLLEEQAQLKAAFAPSTEPIQEESQKNIHTGEWDHAQQADQAGQM